jgi:hypothetical protein
VQGIPKKLAAFTGAGGRPISRAKANALVAKGDADGDYGAGGVIGIGGNPHPATTGRGLVAQRVGEGGGLGGVVEALGQFGCGLGSGIPLEQRIDRRRGGWGTAWPMRSAAAKRPEPPSSTKPLPGVVVGTRETSETIQGQASHSHEARSTTAPGKAAFTASGQALSWIRRASSQCQRSGTALAAVEHFTGARHSDGQRRRYLPSLPDGEKH